jgi:hypothetical protein
VKSFDLHFLRESMKMDFSAEAFNGLNHPQFCGPNTAIDGGSFGQVWSTCNSPREVQLGLKHYW